MIIGLIVLVAIVAVLTFFMVRERRANKRITFDPYASRGKADDDARLRAHTLPNQTGGIGL